MEKFGTANIKKVVKFACDFMKQTAYALEDGKFQWTEGLSFIDELVQIPGVIKAFPELRKEIADLSLEERKELHDYIMEEFDIPNDAVETVIENSLDFAMAAATLYEQWKALKKK